MPTGKALPAGTPVRVTVTEQLSVATALPSVASGIVAPHVVAAGPVLALNAAGGVSTGFSVSFTVMVWVALEVLVCASVAVHVIVVTPTG